ncbi:hypothetical protein B0H13DRAFT_1909620 [Mycena leptocephala]|nr:hypothetical protein B0H13DRAFT_1909620 [Mycena leptocephala]
MSVPSPPWVTVAEELLSLCKGWLLVFLFISVDPNQSTAGAVGIAGIIMVNLQSIALAAANGSLEDLSKASEVLAYPPLRTSPSATWLLPVFYAHLDPSIILTPDAVDAMMVTATRLPCIDAACIALKALSHFVDMPVFAHVHGAALDLWLCIWPWMQFLHTYWGYIPGFSLKAEIPACLNCSLISKLRVDDKTRGLTTWTAILLDDAVAEQSDLLRQSARLLPTLADGLDIAEI